MWRAARRAQPATRKAPLSDAEGFFRVSVGYDVSVRYIFRCQFCTGQPDPLTQLALEVTIREATFGAYQDALPGRWLVWHGKGLYGPTRYACDEHRADLVAYLRAHYGTIGFHPWKRPPYPSSLASGDTERAWRIATRRGITGGF